MTTTWQHSGLMSALLAVAQVMIVGWVAGTLAFAALFAAVFVRRTVIRQPAQVQPGNAPAQPDAQPLPPETPIETPNGGVYTLSEYQALRARYTDQQWKAFEGMAAQYAAMHVTQTEVGE